MGILKAPLFCFLQTVNKAFTEKEICNLEPSAWSFTKKDQKKKKKLLTTGSSKAVGQSAHSVVSNSLQPQGLQHARPPCP